jgi:hypothetical protein
MTIVFSDKEELWVNKKPFNWSIKEGCPADIRKTLEKKIRLLYGKPQGIGGQKNGTGKS